VGDEAVVDGVPGLLVEAPPEDILFDELPGAALRHSAAALQLVLAEALSWYSSEADFDIHGFR
jgi:hypothetical protein